MGRERLEIEFGRYTSWVVDAISQLGDAQVIPAACRGMGNPALLRTIARLGGLAPGVRVLDVGCGIGGPAAWLARGYGCDVVAIDVMETAVKGARTLFSDLSTAQASWRFLPFRDESFDIVTAIGVLELVDDKATCLKESKRVLRPGGIAIVYDHLRTCDVRSEAPIANRFVTHEHFVRLVEEAGFVKASDRPIDYEMLELGPWRRVAVSIQEAIALAHEGDPALEKAQAEIARFLRLRKNGSIVPRLMALAA